MIQCLPGSSLPIGSITFVPVKKLGEQNLGGLFKKKKKKPLGPNFTE